MLFPIEINEINICREKRKRDKEKNKHKAKKNKSTNKPCLNIFVNHLTNKEYSLKDLLYVCFQCLVVDMFSDML